MDRLGAFGVFRRNRRRWLEKRLKTTYEARSIDLTVNCDRTSGVSGTGPGRLTLRDAPTTANGERILPCVIS
jgi:hypothetical protein